MKVHNVGSDISKLVFWGLYRRVHLSSFFAQPGMVVDPSPISVLQNKKSNIINGRSKLKRQLLLNPIHLTDTSAADLPVSFRVTKNILLSTTWFISEQQACFPLSAGVRHVKHFSQTNNDLEENHSLLIIGVHPFIVLFSAHPTL